MSPANIAERLPQEIDVIDKKTQAALSQIGREEKATAADKVSPIVRHRASIAQQKVMGFATLNPSYGLRSTHPTGCIMLHGRPSMRLGAAPIADSVRHHQLEGRPLARQSSQPA